MNRIPTIFLSMALLAGCDPFAPAQPESPTTQIVTRASTADMVPVLWDAHIHARDPNLLYALTTGDVVMVGAGNSISSERLGSCLESLFASDSVAPVSTISRWTKTVIGPDTVKASLDYSLFVGGVRQAHGSAVWTVLQIGISEWKLSRWDDDRTSDSSWFAYCQRRIVR